MNPAGPDHQAFWIDAIAGAQAYPGKIGILIRDHGEIEEYNATTYESIKEFVQRIWPYTGLPNEVLSVDHGSFFLEQAHPFDSSPRTDALLVDPWLMPWNLPATPLKDQLDTGALGGIAPECV